LRSSSLEGKMAVGWFPIMFSTSTYLSIAVPEVLQCGLYVSDSPSIPTARILHGVLLEYPLAECRMREQCRLLRSLSNYITLRKTFLQTKLDRKFNCIHGNRLPGWKKFVSFSLKT